ncbi:MAG: TetR/AcrR family transcriptional regulator [Pseudomonadota bacterium]
MSHQIDARIQKSQTALIRAGMSLLSKNSEASLSDIAREAGVGRTTLYRLYDTKEQLIKAIAIHCLGAFDKATEHLERDADSALHAIELMFKAIFPLSAEMEFLMKLSEREEGDPEIVAIYERQANDIVELVESAKVEGSLSNDVPTVWVVNLIEALMYIAWLNRNKPIDHDALADLAFQTFCNGVSR